MELRIHAESLAFPNQHARLKTESQSARELFPLKVNQSLKKHGRTRKEKKDFSVAAKAESFSLNELLPILILQTFLLIVLKYVALIIVLSLQ